MNPEDQKDTPPVSPVPAAASSAKPPHSTPASTDSTISPDAALALFLPPKKVSLLRQSNLLVASLVVYIANVVCLMLSYSTQDYDSASMIATITVWLGILGAALLGAGMVQIALRSVNYNGGHISGMARLGILLSLLSIVTGGLTLIPGLILLLIGFTRPAPATNVPISTTKKTLLAIGMFIGGGILGLAISLVIYLITSSRACQLSSSKCY